jgi:hypothetical protein
VLLLLGLFCIARSTRIRRALPALALAGLGTAAASETITLMLGTAGNDTLTGTLGADTINGLGGADLMIGLSGNDTYIVNTEWDEVVEQSGEGSDTVRASSGSYLLPANVEKLVLTGTKDGFGIGNDLGNRIIGTPAITPSTGDAGKMTLLCRAGPDLFRFQEQTEPPLSAEASATKTDSETGESLNHGRTGGYRRSAFLHYTRLCPPAFEVRASGEAHLRQGIPRNVFAEASHRHIIVAEFAQRLPGIGFSTALPLHLPPGCSC